jgi:hypothetical protein
MKKVLLYSIIAIAAIYNAANANAQRFSAAVSFGARVPERQSFYYYPSANAYFNIETRQYVYQREGAWITANYLPADVCVDNAQRFMVYHNGYDVWRENHEHMIAYARYRHPEIAYRDYGYRNRDYRFRYDDVRR